MTIRSLIGSAFLFLIFIVIVVGGTLAFYPQWVASTFGIGPLSLSGIWTLCLSIAAGLGAIFWLIERMFDRLGKAGVRIQWRKRKNQQTEAPATSDTVSPSPSFFTGLDEQMRFRYGRFWRRKVQILWLTGETELVEKIVPGLTEQNWQEGDDTLLLWGGLPDVPVDSERAMAARLLRPRRPLDGIVHVLEGNQLPGTLSLDETLRQRQKTDALLGWQAPVYFWVLDTCKWSQEGRETQPVGCLLSGKTSTESVITALDALIPALREQGMSQLAQDTRYDFLLRLTERLREEWRAGLSNVLTTVSRGSSPMMLRGLMFSLPSGAEKGSSHSWEALPEWQGILQDCRNAQGKRKGWPWEKILQCTLLTLAVVWGAGVLLSLFINQHQIADSHEQATIAADTTQPLASRLNNQLALQQEIAKLQYRETAGSPWYTRFGLNQNASQLAALWPLYQANNNVLIRDASATKIKAKLTDFIRLPPGSPQRDALTQQTYAELKAYLMMSRPDKADATFLSQTLMTLWPKRTGVPDGQWQHVGPKLIAFWGQNLSAHPEWKIAQDKNLVTAVRQILLKQIGQRNAEASLYQAMLKKVANNYPDMTLTDMVGDTDASYLFNTDEVVPGMFTRQAWEEQVQDAIDQVVTTRRNEIDWVLTSKSQPASAEISPEALKARLTERYFTDFSNAWLNMVNSLRWQEPGSLSGAISQLTLMADVRQSPMVALMNTLAWQGKTGQKNEALADTLVNSAKVLVGKKQQPVIKQTGGPQGPLDAAFGPLLTIMDGKSNGVNNGNLSLQAYLTRVTQVRLKLQQVTTAPDPQAMTQMLAQTVFQGKAVDLTDTRDYGSLVAASLGQEWSGFGKAMFVEPMELAWRQVLQPAAGSLNAQWQSTVVNQWDTSFAGRYPFASTGSDASLPVVAQYLRSDSGRISQFLKTQLGGILHQEGNRWVPDAITSQGLTFNPAFLEAINQLGQLSDIVFAEGDAGLRFELMARPSKNVVRTQLAVDGQNLDYFNQMESWQSFKWPGNSYYPGVQLSWRSVSSGMQLFGDFSGNWGLIRLLEKAQVTQLDSSRYQLVWKTPDGLPLKYILRTEMSNGPLALLALRNFSLPKKVFLDDAPVSSVVAAEPGPVLTDDQDIPAGTGSAGDD